MLISGKMSNKYPILRTLGPEVGRYEAAVCPTYPPTSSNFWYSSLRSNDTSVEVRSRLDGLDQSDHTVPREQMKVRLNFRISVAL